MPDRKTNDYTVCVLFDGYLRNVLLVRKARTDFKGKLNGVGGRVEPGEDPYEGALREIYEETGLSPQDLKSLGLVRLAKLGELLVPEDCKTHDAACRLHYYTGAVKTVSVAEAKGRRDEPLSWVPWEAVAGSGTASQEYAGGGDLAYFTAAARRKILSLLPEDAVDRGPAPDGLPAAIAEARGRLDADFRRRDLFQASLDAADVSKLAYAAFYLQALEARGGTAGEGGAWHAGPEAEKKPERLETDEIV